MHNATLAFENNLSIGYLDISTMKLIRIKNVNETHSIFQGIRVPFDYYYSQNEKIIAIPDSVQQAKTIKIWNQEIVSGEFIIFFNFEEIDEKNVLFMRSLTLPQFTHVEKEISKINKG